MRGLPPTVQAMLWMACSGVLFSILNATSRLLATQLDPMQAQFLRYLFGVLVFLPWVWASGWRQWGTVQLSGHLWRSLMHTAALMLWFTALPHIGLADMTAIGFTGPIFVMLGAAWFLREPLHLDRWVAAMIGFVGVLIVVLPGMSGQGGWYHLVMLASSPVFAASVLLSKSLTRRETSGQIVLWQSMLVTLLSLPAALPVWQAPTLWQWLAFAMTGVVGSLSHMALTRAMKLADLSVIQPLRFLDLLWAAVLGWLLFGDWPNANAWLGGAVILAATVWIARRTQRKVQAQSGKG